MRTVRGPQYPTRRALAVSLAAHGIFVLVVLLATWRAHHAARAPIRFAVQPSLFSTPARPPTAPEPELPAVTREETAPTPQPTVVDVAPEPLRDVAHAAPSASAPPRSPRAIDARLLTRVVMRRTEAPPAPTRPDPREATTMPAAVARPEVPSPLPGHNPAPDYPAAASARRIEGTVVVSIDVADDGSARTAVVVRGSGSVLLDTAARRAALRWRFRNGPGQVEVPFVFRLAART